MKSSPRADPPAGWIARWGAPSLILLIAFGLRLCRLGDANLWWDEALAIWGVRKGLLGVTLWTAGDVHPPLYFWSLWGWVQLAGESEFAMRMLSLAFGVLTVAVVYSLGSLVGGRTVGSLAALLTSLSRFHIWWSQEMRMYVLAGLAGTLSIYFFLRWLRAERSDALPSRVAHLSPSPWLFLYVLASVSALYTIFLIGALLLVQNIVILIILIWPRGYRRKSLLPKWIASQGAILVALGAWLALAWGRMSTWSVAKTFAPRLFARLYATLLITGVSVNIERYAWAVLFPFLVLLVGGGLLLGKWWRDRHRYKPQVLDTLTLVLAFALPPIAIYVASLPRALFYTPRIEARYFLPFAPAFWTLLAWSVVLIGKRWRAIGWACGSVLLALWIAFLPGYYSGRLLRDKLQTMVRTIISQAEPGDAVLLDSGGRFPVFLYYYDRIPDTCWRPPPPMLTVSREETILSASKVDAEMTSIAKAYRRIWLAEVDVNLTDPERLVRSWLDERYEMIWSRGYAHTALYLYAPEGQPSLRTVSSYMPQYPLDEPMGTEGLLRGWEMPVATFTFGDTIHVSLLWDLTPIEPVSLALRNPLGQVVLRRHAGPSDERQYQRQQFDFYVSSSLPDGRYDLLLSPPPPGGPELGTVRIVHTPALPHAGPPEQTLHARLGQHIILEGYTLSTTAKGGLAKVTPKDRLILDLYFCASGAPGKDMTVFTHLLGEAYNPKTQGPVWGQHDAPPCDGEFPTSLWLDGDTIVDRHIICIDGDAPAGTYRVEVGMYTPEDGSRVVIKTQDGRVLEDHLVLEEQVEIRSP